VFRPASSWGYRGELYVAPQVVAPTLVGPCVADITARFAGAAEGVVLRGASLRPTRVASALGMLNFFKKALQSRQRNSFCLSHILKSADLPYGKRRLHEAGVFPSVLV